MEEWDLLPRTILHREVRAGSPWLRWCLVAIAGALVLLVDGRPSPSLWVVVGVAAYNGVVHALRLVRWDVPLSIAGLADIAAILVAVALRGTPGTAAHLFLLVPLLMLTVAYGGAGAIVTTALCVLGYGGVGVLSADGAFPRGVLSVGDGLLLFGVVGAGAAYAVGRYETLVRRLLHLSMTDPLTGLFNRRFFFQSLERAWMLADRDEQDYSLVLVDLKDFKAINDRRGHDVGDQVLERISEHLLRKVRLQDVVARIGGDEFAILLPATGMGGGVATARRLVRHLDETDSILASLALSVGVAQGRAGDAGSERTFAAADRALLAAKREQGSTVMVAGDDPDAEVRSADELPPPAGEIPGT